MTRPLVIVPTYEEAGSVTSVGDGILAADGRIDVLAVDDNSPDGTAARCRDTAP